MHTARDSAEVRLGGGVGFIGRLATAVMNQMKKMSPATIAAMKNHDGLVSRAACRRPRVDRLPTGRF
jgi:hypothetical protein